jgi:hypothetical protein
VPSGAQREPRDRRFGLDASSLRKAEHEIRTAKAALEDIPSQSQWFADETADDETPTEETVACASTTHQRSQDLQKTRCANDGAARGPLSTRGECGDEAP